MCAERASGSNIQPQLNGNSENPCLPEETPERRYPAQARNFATVQIQEIPRTFVPLSTGRTAIEVCLWRGLQIYLVYLINQERENGSLKNIDLCDQKIAPLTPNSFIYNRHPFSQAGRRRFESGLPLHLVNHLHASPNQILSHLSQLDADGSDLKALKSDHSAVTASCFRATEESTYLSR